MTDDDIRDAAREQYGGNDLEVDGDARVARTDDGRAWVQAWVLVENVEKGAA